MRCLVRGARAWSGDRDLEPQGNSGWLSLRACPHCYFIWCSKPHSAELFTSVSACKSVKCLLLSSPFAERKLRLPLSDTPMVTSLVNSAAGLCVLFFSFFFFSVCPFRVAPKPLLSVRLPPDMHLGLSFTGRAGDQCSGRVQRTSCCLGDSVLFTSPLYLALFFLCHLSLTLSFRFICLLPVSFIRT